MLDERIPQLLPSGVDMTGLGCSLAEWDAIAATMPPELRPSMRGAWSPAFEAAAIRYRKRAGASAVEPTGVTFPARVREIAATLVNGPRSLTDIALIVDRDPPSVREDLLALLSAGILTVDAPAFDQVRARRYALAPDARHAMAPTRLSSPRLPAEGGDA